MAFAMAVWKECHQVFILWCSSGIKGTLFARSARLPPNLLLYTLFLRLPLAMTFMMV
jgi:hypothetical protein